MRSAIERRVAALPEDSAFTSKDFADVASAETSRRVLKDLADEGTICRAARGLYYKPRYSKLLGAPVPVDVDAAAHAVARSRRWTIAPSGQTALNRLGLDTQVPATFEYISDGPYADMVIGGVPVRFKHTANKDVTNLSPATLLVVQALKALGRGRASEELTRRIASRLSEGEKRALLDETLQATAWVRESARAIAEGAKG